MKRIAAVMTLLVLSTLLAAPAHASSAGSSSSLAGDDPSGLGRRVVGAGVLRGASDETSITATFSCSGVSVGDAASTAIVDADSAQFAPAGFTGCWVEQHQLVNGTRKWVPVADAPGRGLPGPATTTADTTILGLNGPLRVCWEVVTAYTDGYVPRTSDCGLTLEDPPTPSISRLKRTVEGHGVWLATPGYQSLDAGFDSQLAFACTARATGGAIATSVESCTLESWEGTASAPPRTLPGAASATAGTGSIRHPSSLRLCFTVSATYSDGEVLRHSACSMV